MNIKYFSCFTEKKIFQLCKTPVGKMILECDFYQITLDIYNNSKIYKKILLHLCLLLKTFAHYKLPNNWLLGPSLCRI